MDRTVDPMAFKEDRTYTSKIKAASNGKVRQNPRLIAGERTGVFILAGQSLAAGSVQQLYTPTNIDKIGNINIYDGAMYAAADPLLGHGLSIVSSANWGCVFTRVADLLISNGVFDRVILIPVAYGATTVAQWDSDLHKLIIVGYRRAKALGIPAISGILWQQGESDSATATQASYSASWLSMKAKVAAEFSAPWFVAKSTYIPGGSTNAGIRAACAGFVDNATVYAGPDTDVLGSGNRYDDQHWNATGSPIAANLWLSSLDAVF